MHTLIRFFKSSRSKTWACPCSNCKWGAVENPINLHVWFRFIYSQKWTCVAFLFPKQIYNVLSPNFHIHVTVDDLYNPISLSLHCKYTVPKIRNKYSIPRNKTARLRSPFLHLCICERFIYSHHRSAKAIGSQIGGPIVGIYKSLTDTWM